MRARRAAPPSSRCHARRPSRRLPACRAGNAYVAEAKRQVFGHVGIDMLAGPSEILVISDGGTPADWLAMDLFSQAEHDEAARAVLVSPERAHLDAVEAAIERLLGAMPRREIIAASLEKHGALI